MFLTQNKKKIKNCEKLRRLQTHLKFFVFKLTNSKHLRFEYKLNKFLFCEYVYELLVAHQKNSALSCFAKIKISQIALEREKNVWKRMFRAYNFETQPRLLTRF